MSSEHLDTLDWMITAWGDLARDIHITGDGRWQARWRDGEVITSATAAGLDDALIERAGRELAQ